jgi:hypothetical protein
MQTTVQQGSWQKQWGQLVAQVWSDENLKQRLIDDPENVLREFGIEVPDDVEFRVMEDTDRVQHLVLPPSPSDDILDDELTSSPAMFSFSGLCGGCGRCGCGSRRCGCDANS